MRKHLIATIILVLALGLMQSVSFAEKRGGVMIMEGITKNLLRRSFLKR
jgi:hypothetical protein